MEFRQPAKTLEQLRPPSREIAAFSVVVDHIGYRFVARATIVAFPAEH